MFEEKSSGSLNASRGWINGRDPHDERGTIASYTKPGPSKFARTTITTQYFHRFLDGVRSDSGTRWLSDVWCELAATHTSTDVVKFSLLDRRDQTKDQEITRAATS